MQPPSLAYLAPFLSRLPLENNNDATFSFHHDSTLGLTWVAITAILVMSQNSKEGEKTRSQTTKQPGRPKMEGRPTSYDETASVNYQEEVMHIPKDKAGLLIGKKGWRVKDIMEKSGVKKLSIKEDLVHLRGTEEQRANAKKIIDTILRVRLKFGPHFVTFIALCLSY